MNVQDHSQRDDRKRKQGNPWLLKSTERRKAWLREASSRKLERSPVPVAEFLVTILPAERKNQPHKDSHGAKGRTSYRIETFPS